MATCTCADPTAVSQAIRTLGSNLQSAINTGNTNTRNIDATLHGQKMGGTTGAPAPVRFFNWAAPEYGNVGENIWSIAWEAAATAIAIANGLAQAEIASKAQDLAESYYQQHKFKWDRFNNNYRPLEIKLLDEVSTTPIREMDCDDARSRARNAVSSAYGSVTSALTREAKRLRLCIDPATLSVLNHNQAVMLIDSENYNLLDEQFYTDYWNDKRWNRRSAMLNLGRNLSAEALKYGDVARNLYSQVGNQIDRAANGVMGAIGYYGARNDTYYPTTYLGSNGGAGNSTLVDTKVKSNINIVSDTGAS